MKIVLQYLNGSLKGRETAFTGLPIVLGADPRDDIFYDGFYYRMVGKSHAQIVAQGEALILADRSDNFVTLLNNQPVPQGGSVSLRAGDRISLGENGPGVVVISVDTRAIPAADPAKERAVAAAASVAAAAAVAAAPAPAAAAASGSSPEKLTLEFTDGGRKGQLRVFTASPVGLGRKPGASLLFDRTDEDSAVSGSHARLEWSGRSWLIVDNKSTNGTYLNGVRVTQSTLKSGDFMQLTPKGAKLRISIGEGALAPAVGSATLASPAGGKTVSLSSLQDDAAPPLLRLEILSGEKAGQALAFSQPEIRLGRAPGNDVITHDAQGGVSGEHCVIRFEAGAWTLHDKGSTNGTFVGGKKISAPVVLKGDELIRLSAWGPEFKVRFGAANAQMSQKVGQKTLQMAIMNAVTSVKRDEDVKRSAALAGMEKQQASARRGLWVLLVLVIAGAVGGGWFLWQRTQKEMLAQRQASEAAMVKMRASEEAMRGQIAKYEQIDADRTSRIDALSKQLADTKAAGSAAGGEVYNQLLGEVNNLKAQNGAMRGQLAAQLQQAQQQRSAIANAGGDDAGARARQQKLDQMIAQYNQRMTDIDQKSRSLDQRLAAAPAAAASSAGGGLGKAQIYSQNVKGVVLIRQTYESEGQRMAEEGTGFCVKPGGTIITNRHVAQPWTDGDGRSAKSGKTISITVYFSGQKEGWSAHVVRDHSDPEVDLAVLKIDGGGGFPTVMGLEPNDDGFNVGEEAYIIGYPLGSGTYNEGVTTPTFTAGSLSKKTVHRLQYDTTTFPGSSGSPVFNNVGKIVAVHFSGQNSNSGQKAQGINYGIPVVYVHELLR